MTILDVALMGFVGDVAASRRMCLDIPAGSTVRETLDALTQLHGPGLRSRLLTVSGELQPGVLLSIAGERVCNLGDPLPRRSSLPLEIVVLQAAAGG